MKKVYILIISDVKQRILLIFNKKKNNVFIQKIVHLKNVNHEYSSHFEKILWISPIFGDISKIIEKKIERLKNINRGINSYFDN